MIFRNSISQKTSIQVMDKTYYLLALNLPNANAESEAFGLAVRPDGLKRVVVKKQEGAGKKVVST